MLLNAIPDLQLEDHDVWHCMTTEQKPSQKQRRNIKEEKVLFTLQRNPAAPMALEEREKSEGQ